MVNFVNLLKRLLVAGVAIPTVIYAILIPELMIIITTVLSYAGMREFILIRTQVLRHAFTKTGAESDKNEQKEDMLPPKMSNYGLQIFIRCLLSVFVTLGGYFCSTQGLLSGSGIPAHKEESKYGAILASFIPLTKMFQENVHSSTMFLFVSIVCIVLLFCLVMFEWLDSGLPRENHHQGKLRVEDLLSIMLDGFGFVYVGLSLSVALFLTRASKVYMTLLCLGNWASDSMALAFGKNFGRFKLYPKLSPNKTIEGGIGAMIGAVLASLLYRQIIIYGQIYGLGDADYQVPSNFVFVMNGVLIGFFSIVGDLCESYLKRLGYIKDSGQFFGAHGGVLDRIDGLLFTFPIMYFVLLCGGFH